MNDEIIKKELIISVISHTNVGKTSLIRTLLRRDVGEVLDSAHVTIISKSYVIVESDKYVAKIWDTPGFGSNLSKLVDRIKNSSNPIGWILHQVWDKHLDKSLWCSQEAIKNVKSESDVVLYLIDSSQPPSSLAYINLEIKVIQWIGKPVLVFLNQTGGFDNEKDKSNEAKWKSHLAQYDIVKEVSTLDAFNRSWTKENIILEQTASVLKGDKKKIAEELNKVWIKRNLEIFDKSISILVDLAFFALTDKEAIPEESLMDRLKLLVNKKNRSDKFEKIQKSMYIRLAENTLNSVNELIKIHGIEGESASDFVNASKNAFNLKKDLKEPIMATLGGAVSGLFGGLSADFVSGGLTFGGGAVIGMLLGGMTTYAMTWGYNLTQSGKNQVRWSENHFKEQINSMIILYLAITHYGRAKGEWKDPTFMPDVWQEKVVQKIEQNSFKWTEIWKLSLDDSNDKKIKVKLKNIFKNILISLFSELYPENNDIFKNK